MEFDWRFPLEGGRSLEVSTDPETDDVVVWFDGDVAFSVEEQEELLKARPVPGSGARIQSIRTLIWGHRWRVTEGSKHVRGFPGRPYVRSWSTSVWMVACLILASAALTYFGEQVLLAAGIGAFGLLLGAIALAVQTGHPVALGLAALAVFTVSPILSCSPVGLFMIYLAIRWMKVAALGVWGEILVSGAPAGPIDTDNPFDAS